MDEELVRDDVMDEEFVKNFVMDAKIDPKVVKDVSRFKILGWKVLHPLIKICWRNLLMSMNLGCSSEFQTEIHSL